MDDATKNIIRDSDPSSLTTQQLQREIASLKEFFNVEISGIKEAVKTAHENLVRVPTEVQQRVGDLKELHEKWFLEKFAGIEKVSTEIFNGLQKQLEERDVRVEQAAKDRKATVDGELSAQEKAAQKQYETLVSSIAKSEIGTAKQIDQQGLLIQRNAETVDDKIGDLKDRVTTIESIAVGAINNKSSTQSSGNYVVGIIGLIVGIIIAVITIALRK